MSKPEPSMIGLLKQQRSFFVSVAVLTVVAAAFAAGWFSGVEWFKTRDASRTVKEIRLGGYQFINPLLECESGGNESGNRELRPFQHRIQSFIEERKRARPASHTSVYFRAMNDGMSFSIDGHEKFAPASLVKVPLLMAYMKWAESMPGLLSQRIVNNLPMDMNANQRYKPARAIGYGKAYTVDELLYYMIAYSDNNAYFLLFGSIDPAVLHRVYTDLGLTVPRFGNDKEYMSVSDYSSFFRMLFNASYLNKELSEKALQYLSKVNFEDGISSGVPPGVVVAQKFGERTFGDRSEIKQLHDCGIVYYPEHPYLLCVMTRGDSFEQLGEVIRGLSRLVYEEIDQQHKRH
jgi:beta-lactamase class A